VNDAVLLACGVVTTVGVIAIGWAAGLSHQTYRPAMSFCLEILGLFGNGCWR
jgi:hypothetical protein